MDHNDIEDNLGIKKQKLSTTSTNNFQYIIVDQLV